MNKEIFDFLGITKFHEKGYKGKDIKIASLEVIDKNIFPDVITFNDNKPTSTHGTEVMDVIEQVCPEATKYSVLVGYSKKGNNIQSDEIDFLINEDVRLITLSKFNGSGELTKEPLYRQLIENGATFNYGIGNYDDEKYSIIEPSDLLNGIAAVEYPSLERAYYSSITEKVDFATFGTLKMMHKKKTVTGTSFASPLFTGMLVLVQCYFLENLGRELTREELIEFIKENTRDIDLKGKDINTGYGIFILPNPKDIDFRRYKNMINVNKKITPYNRTIRTNKKNLYIVIHFTANDGDTAKNNADYFFREKLKSSAHYFVDENEIWQVVEDKDSAWHVGNTTYIHKKCRNSNSIGIEMCSRVNKNTGQYYIKEKTILNALVLTQELMKKYNIPIENVLRHYDVTGKRCPAPFVDDINLWNSFKSRLKEKEDEAMLKELCDTYGEANVKTALELLVKSITDDGKPADWAKKEFEDAIKNKITDGSNPERFATRQEVAIMVNRAKLSE